MNKTITPILENLKRDRIAAAEAIKHLHVKDGLYTRKMMRLVAVVDILTQAITDMEEV